VRKKSAIWHRQDICEHRNRGNGRGSPAVLHAHHAGFAGFSLIAPDVPILLCAPKFLDGSMSLDR
jgi:hypothetical protein